MNHIISKLQEIIKQTGNMIEMEESVQRFMYETISDSFEEIFTSLDQVIKEEKQKIGWTVERVDTKTTQFTFGEIRFNHTLMHDSNGDPHYPFDEWIGLRKYQRYSALVEVKVAELVSEGTYRETARTLNEWTALQISHTTVGHILRTVGKAQIDADEEMVKELDEAASLPEGKKIAYLYAEADGVFVRGTKRKKSHEVRHAVMYEGWDKNGKRISLKVPHVVMTTQPTQSFWKEVQVYAANRYSLEHTQIVTNSDGGQGYTADKFQEAFSQSTYPVLNQLDAYHVAQAITRTFGVGKGTYKNAVKKAISAHDLESFTLQLDTYESMLENDREIEKVQKFRSYILNNWLRIFDWREKISEPPEGARKLGAMESNQRHVSFRMKKRGMHWSAKGAEAMVKVKQGILNKTLHAVYLKGQSRSARKQREVKKAIRTSQILRQKTRPSIGVRNGTISLNSAHSTAMGNLVKALR